jgi:peptidyl-prolyl cis-trans isomerase D
MISSMQKNKKWLLPTIWISTIAFVGAGFVGWGSYNPSSGASNVATVGKVEISMQDLNQEYTNLYSQYQQTFGKQFNDELAKQLKLEKTAYDNVVQKSLLLNFSNDFGFTVSNEEVYKELLKIPSFVVDGKFDNATYKSILKQNRTTPNDFEEQIKKNILIGKIQSVYDVNINENTIENLNKLFFASDKAEINIIDSKDISVSTDDKQIQEFYDKNKENYKSIEKFEVNVFKVAIQEDEKASKKEALKRYLKLKKGSEKFSETEILDKNTNNLSLEEQTMVFDSEVGKVLKPIKVNNEFVIYSLKKKIAPEVVSLSEIKNQIDNDLKAQKLKNALNMKKNNLIKNFTGTDIGYITKGTLPKIDGLNDEEINKLASKISTATSVIDFIEFDNKTVVFKILDTKLATYDKTKDQYLKDTIMKLKSNEVLENLLEKLKNKYEIQSNFQVN